MILNFKDNQGVQRTDSLKYQYFPSDFFVIGWQWGQHPRISQELTSNMYQTTYWEHELDSIPNFIPLKKIARDLGMNERAISNILRKQKK